MSPIPSSTGAVGTGMGSEEPGRQYGHSRGDQAIAAGRKPAGGRDVHS